MYILYFMQLKIVKYRNMQYILSKNKQNIMQNKTKQSELA